MSGAAEIKAARDFAQRLIGRCIFTWYLLDRQIAQPFLPNRLQVDLATMFSSPANAFRLFDWLRDAINGDLFPMNDPGAERRRLGPDHLAFIKDFIEGRSLLPHADGQGRLFRFRFDAIPVDLISSIYQQFARSSAEDDTHLQGLHYTPVELVHLTLDPVFEGLSPSARIIDPTCGSGAFLVEAFRRLVWKKSGDGPATRKVVRDILYNQLFGVDINRAALGIAAFSLYLAALEFEQEPATEIEDLKFEHLLDATLFEADTISDDFPNKLTVKPFDAVVGNPPWTFDSKRKAPRRKAGVGETARPRRSPDQEFLKVAAKVAGDAGRIGMVMKATPFFSRDGHAIAARNELLQKLRPAALVNLSALRKEELFPDATGPALLFFARCVLMPGGDQLLVGSVPWTPDFKRNGVFHVGPGELRFVPLERVLRVPAILKSATFGTLRDTWLIERLESEFPTLDSVLAAEGIRPKEARGQGYQVDGDPNKPPARFYSKKALTPDEYHAFRLDPKELVTFSHKTLHRVRQPGIYRGPLLICPKACFKSAAELGRYSAAVSAGDMLYTESFYGISFARSKGEWAFALSAILNSSLTTFQLAFGGGAWGLERSTVEPKDLLSIRVPDLSKIGSDALRRLIKAEAAAATDEKAENLAELDAAVGDVYNLERDELVVANESVIRARMLIFEGVGQRKFFIKPPERSALNAYAESVVSVIDSYLRAKRERHLKATVYSRALLRPSWGNGAAGLTAVQFTMAPGGPAKVPDIVHSDDHDDLDTLADRLRGLLQPDLPPYLSERRQIRLYLSGSLYVVKPSENRYWSRTAGLNDADIILAEHWLSREHAAHA